MNITCYMFALIARAPSYYPTYFKDWMAAAAASTVFSLSVVVLGT